MAQLLRISANSSREVRATVQAMKLFPTELRRVIRLYTKSELGSAWLEELEKPAASKIQKRVLVRTARVAVSDQNVMLKSATVGRPLGGLMSKPSDLAQAYEFGGDRNKVQSYRTRSRKGTSYTVTRHTQRQLPARRRGGYIVYPAAAKFIPRAAKLWVQTTVRTFYDLIEGRHH